MYKKKMVKMLALGTSLILGTAILAGCGSGKGKEAGEEQNSKVTLTFSIWDKLQQEGMQNMVDAFEKENPNIHVKVEYTLWEQYWTKLQASGTSDSLPDVFWMHPEQVYTYAEGGKLLDMSSKIEESSVTDLSKFPQNINDDFNVDGRQYAIPKDYSTFGLWYNKDLFDARGMAYPDDTWDWNKLKEAAAQLTDKENGVYGMLVQYNTNDAAYHYIWQNEGDIINEEETKSLYDDKNTIEAIEYMVDFIEKGYSPTMTDYANTTADQYFESGKAAMHIGGSWMASEYLGIDGLNCDVAPLAKGKIRADLCGGMGYSIAANTKNPEEAWKFVEFLSGEKANTIQSESGAAISAYKGTQKPWLERFPDIHAQVFVDASEYGFSSQYCATRSEWVNIEEDYMTQIFSGTLPVEEGCKTLAGKVDEILQ